jgi:hypothetical protein
MEHRGVLWPPIGQRVVRQFASLLDVVELECLKQLQSKLFYAQCFAGGCHSRLAA